jgi:sucrose-6-phosphate hydrolase SacC (GH32 family)
MLRKYKKYLSIKRFMNQLVLTVLACFVCALSFAQKAAPKPLYHDPVYDGAADPVVVWDIDKAKWMMLYTNRRATLNDSTGVAWVHGTRIGMAESKDGRKWKYVDTANISYRPDSGYTFWAPEVINWKGIYHMYLTYVPGTFTNWNHPRTIVHLTSSNLKDWKYESTLPLVNDKVIDACVTHLKDGTWRLWYNDEKDGKSIWYADSKDLYQWEDKGKAIAARGEGPKVFEWQGKHFMIVDAWKGMEVYSSDDLKSWTKQANRILEQPGTGTDNQAIGGHCDVVVNNGKAYIFYFTHPGRRKDKPAARNSLEDKRSVIQLAELKYENGEITCDRNEEVKIKLTTPGNYFMVIRKKEY